MFTPKYTVTDKLIRHIKEVTVLVADLNRRLPPAGAVLVQMQKIAQAVSSYASTGIEGNPLPLTDVKRILKTRPRNIRSSEQEVINYNDILTDINRLLQSGPVKIDLALVKSVQRRITQKLIPEYQSGKFRQEPVFVHDPRLHKTIYWPPDHQEVPALMQDLLDYVHRNIRNIDPLILSGIFHKQMVIIHPFMDGNGRTARLLTKILMAGMGLNTFNLFSFENYYNQNVSRYFEMVGEKGNYYDIADCVDFSDWLEYFTDGITDELLRVSRFWPFLAAGPQSELKPYHNSILKTIRQKGYIADHDYARLTSRAKATRIIDFNKLIGMGVIKRRGKGKNTFYVLAE